MNPQTRLNSIRSGEVDWALNIAPADLSAVTQSGASIARGPLGSFALMALIKRANGPLADERVRQALAYATPRQDIAPAIFGTDAVPTSSVVADGAEGYNAGDVNQYAYNPEKARQLLAEAGQANGLKIQVFDPFSTKPPSTETALVRIEDGSDPASGSVRPKQPTNSPVRNFGRYFCRCCSEPKA